MLLSKSMNKSLKFFVLLRTFLVIFVAYFTNLSDIWKLVLLILFDNIDSIQCTATYSEVFKKKGMKNISDFIDNGICKTYDYQIHDKINDLFTEIVLYNLFFDKINKIKYMNTILPVSLIWRGIGIIKYTKNKDRNIYVKHPDLFRELFIYAFLIKFNEPNVNIIIIIILFKIIFENYWHNIKVKNVR